MKKAKSLNVTQDKANPNELHELKNENQRLREANAQLRSILNEYLPGEKAPDEMKTKTSGINNKMQSSKPRSAHGIFSEIETQRTLEEMRKKNSNCITIKSCLIL